MAILVKQQGALLLLMLNLFLVFTGIGLVIPIMPSFMNELGVSGSMMGLTIAVFSLAQFLFSPLAGRLSDTVGRKRMIVVGMFIFAVSEGLFGIAHSPTLMFVSRALGGLSAAMIMPAVMAYAADITTDEERAAGMGYVNASITTGFIIGPGIGGYLAEFGIRTPFYAAGVGGIVAAIVTLLFLKESLPAKGTEASQAEVAEPRSGLLAQLKHSYRAPYFLSLVIVFVMSFGLANFETIYSLFVDHKFGFDPKDIAFVITFGSIAGAVVQLTIFSWLLNRFGEKPIIAACLLVAGIFVLLMLFVHRFWLIFAVTFAVFLAIDILRPTIGTQMSKLAKDQQGYVAGLNSAFTSLGNIVGPIVAGVLFDFEINAPYTLAAVVLLICFAVSMKGQRRRGVALE
ncbi:MFS transporter [Cohnella ginsengisoli]|uniref:MFS transporter n=1 Tax=Cohnella ginsengisoli TaxID=425004 RepID=A0A9X4QNE3_9BACL|nr:MFS transporter [Cohnella ginsengisoli]MDG0792307.1 MFS transporter [Cohnella ginsengisoli]